MVKNNLSLLYGIFYLLIIQFLLAGCIDSRQWKLKQMAISINRNVPIPINEQSSVVKAEALPNNILKCYIHTEDLSLFTDSILRRGFLPERKEELIEVVAYSEDMEIIREAEIGLIYHVSHPGTGRFYELVVYPEEYLNRESRKRYKDKLSFIDASIRERREREGKLPLVNHLEWMHREIFEEEDSIVYGFLIDNITHQEYDPDTFWKTYYFSPVQAEDFVAELWEEVPELVFTVFFYDKDSIELDRRKYIRE